MKPLKYKGYTIYSHDLFGMRWAEVYDENTEFVYRFESVFNRDILNMNELVIRAKQMINALVEKKIKETPPPLERIVFCDTPEFDKVYRNQEKIYALLLEIKKAIL